MGFRKIAAFLLLFCASGFSLEAQAKLRVIVTLPDFIEVIESVGGDDVQVSAFLSGTEDAHFLDAVPSFVSSAASADVICSTGLGLEVGWLPKVLTRSGNAKVQSGGPGFCELGRRVQVLEKPTGVIDRSMGDVHPEGNPHFNLSPTALKAAAREAAFVLSRHLPEKREKFEKNLANFESRMDQIKRDTHARLAPIREKKILQYHKDFTYFFEEYSLKSAGALEEKPGVPPSAARVASLATSNVADVCLAARHAPKRHIEKWAELSGKPVAWVSAMVRPSVNEYSTIEKLQRAIVDELLKALK